MALWTKRLDLKTVAIPWLVLGLILSGLLFPGSSVAKTLTDQLGRNVHVPDMPRRVVSLAPSITEVVYYIGRQDLLVGASRFSDYPEAARELPRVGSYVDLDLERIVALQPDLCIATKDGNPKDVVDRLDNLGIPVYAVNPQGLSSVLDTIREVGSLLNARDHASQLTEQLGQRIRRIDQRVGRTQDRPGIFFQIGVSPIVSVGSGTFIHELIERAGGRNLADAATGYPRFSREQVIGLSPDVIIITSMARGKIFEEVQSEWLSWKSMPAARNDRVFIQDSNCFDRPGPRLVDGLELLANLIHPELFGDTQ
jgi:iron complex transport system substrate-binding protein